MRWSPIFQLSNGPPFLFEVFQPFFDAFLLLVEQCKLIFKWKRRSLDQLGNKRYNTKEKCLVLKKNESYVPHKNSTSKK